MLESVGCNGNKIMTSSGWFDFSDPQISDIKLSSLILGISNTCRFSGQCKFYSVAEHSVHCSYITDTSPLECLIHDMHEGLIGDVAKPLKNMLPEYYKLELQIETLVRKKLGFDYPMTEHCKYIDLCALRIEKEQLFPEVDDFPDMSAYESKSFTIQYWTPEQAQEAFRNRYLELV
jgi:5'-deoxynucleotidase YfbR-like HD superfamily hydrolase